MKLNLRTLGKGVELCRKSEAELTRFVEAGGLSAINGGVYNSQTLRPVEHVAAISSLVVSNTSLV